MLRAAILCLLIPCTAWGDDPVFSGPQPGEILPAFEAELAFNEEKKFDLITQAQGKPVFLLFVHELTRPTAAVTRMLMEYAVTRSKDGLHSAVVFLYDDKTAGIEQLKRARHALPGNCPIAVSLDGGEGPGAYGLNRNVALTVLIGQEGKVMANFALIQPSVQDVPKVLDELVKIIGGQVPSLQELSSKTSDRIHADPKIRELVAPVIRKDATKEQIDQAAMKLEEYAAAHPAFALEIGQIARRIIQAGKLDNYGTQRAQHYLKKWAENYKPAR